MAELVEVAAFTNVHEALLAKSVLEAAGIDATLANEHLVSMTWTYSNVVGGVKVLVPGDQWEEAVLILESDASVVERESTDEPDAPAEGLGDTCQRCGSREFESRLPGKRLAIFSWLVIGVPLGSPVRRRVCRHCGAPAVEADASP